MASSRFPNMSYCMCENTVQALVQIIDHMDEDPENFLRDLSMTELNSFNRLYELCKEFRRSADFVAECADELEFTTEE
jgi:hypothetical protein